MNAPVNTEGFEIPNMNAAICQVMKAVKRLEKADKNAFANYKFTSVDDFKDAVRPLMSEHGLSVRVDEKSFKIKEFQAFDKAGNSKPSTVAVYKYSITLSHLEGGESKPEKRTVALPFVGAQTSGIALSYAIKEWFKSRFLVSAGDQQEEADLLDNTAEMRLGKEAARAVHKELQTEMDSIIAGRDHIELRDWWQAEYYRIKTLPKDWEISLKTEWIRQGKSLKAQADLDKATNDELDKRAEEQE